MSFKKNSQFKFQENKLMKSKSLSDEYSQSIDSHPQPLPDIHNGNYHKNIVHINNEINPLTAS